MTIDRVLREVAPALERRAHARGATLVMDAPPTPRAATDLDAALRTVLLVLVDHASAGARFTIRAVERTGGDVEIVVEGLALPDAFPGQGPFADLWQFATSFLESFHRVRLAHGGDRVFLLVPAADRADRLRRQAFAPGRRGPSA